MSERLKLKVPASTANLGVGFDSIGLALNKFLYVEAEISDDQKWHFHHKGENLHDLPTDENHLIYQVVQFLEKRFEVTVPPLKITMRSEIPLARGLGSSASALVAGIYLADFFGQLQLSEFEMVEAATEIEGHPDNVAPVIYGGMVSGFYNNHTNETYISFIEPPRVNLVITVPSYELKTHDSRQVLPDSFKHGDAVQYSAISNTMLSALIQHDYVLAGKLMEMDGFHEPFRQKLIPEFEKVKSIAKEYKAYATVISGAGPTILTLIDPSKSGKLVRRLNKELDECSSEIITINKSGIIAEKVYE
ncbi:serine kinase [Staphylococcus carnosus]|uniref:homoserine kinase n=1 Tax=Staphylococcus carnosus TaxID=1281 RepID=UPI0006AB7A83|nr:homoserine kinase [Staphylococcus carnosus]KOR13751.1 serine kinase [Staphylococcus carnosus]UTB80800.1 homoserine kinase [Staphylococcus carnosus]